MKIRWLSIVWIILVTWLIAAGVSSYLYGCRLYAQAKASENINTIFTAKGKEFVNFGIILMSISIILLGYSYYRYVSGRKIAANQSLKGRM
jgi:hypothetical protein